MAGAVEEQIEDLRVRVAALRAVPKWKWIPTVYEGEHLAMLMREWPTAHIVDTVVREISALARSPHGTASTTAFTNIRKVLSDVQEQQDAKDPELRVMGQDRFFGWEGNILHIVLVYREKRDNPNQGIQILINQNKDGQWEVHFLARTAANNYIIQGVYRGYELDRNGYIHFLGFW